MEMHLAMGHTPAQGTHTSGPTLVHRTHMLSCFSPVQLFAPLRTVAHQAPLSRFSKQEYWRGLPWPPPGDLPDPGLKLCLLCPLHWQACCLPPMSPRKPHSTHTRGQIT